MSQSIAYVAGTFPRQSETFVYREVRELRRRGWTVHVASLHAPDAPAPEAGGDGADLHDGLVVVYGDRGAMWLIDSVREFLMHPLRAVATVTRAVGDAIVPGERVSVGSRLKILVQAMAGLALGRRLRSRSVALIHCHFAHAPTTVGMYAAAQLGVPFSFTGHANDLFQRRILLRRKLQRAAFVASISHWHRQFFAGIQPSAADKCIVIRCGVDVGEWSGTAVMHESGEADDRSIKIITVCRLVEKKGVDVLIRALAGIKRPADLDVVGDGPERRALEGLARDLCCVERIHFLGALDNRHVLPLLKAADVFVLPCRTDRQGDRDGVPVALMEAMSCGLTVIAGNLPAIAELIHDGEDGLLIPENDDAELVRLLDGLTLAQRHRYGEAARRTIEREFALSLNIDRLERAIRCSTGR